MLKKVLITNGYPRSGKDTFANFVKAFVPTIKYSAVTEIKKIAKFTGWDGVKTPETRYYLSELKRLTTECNDFPFKCMKKAYDEFMIDISHSVLIFDIREPAEIERAVKEFDAKTVLIVNNRCETEQSNYADEHVMDMHYDYVLYNNGTLLEFQKETYNFIQANILSGFDKN